jgi:hypothetical protein
MPKFCSLRFIIAYNINCTKQNRQTHYILSQMKNKGFSINFCELYTGTLFFTVIG